MFFVAVGVVLFLECKLGSDPITVILDGLSATFSISYSTSSLVYNSFILLLALMFARKHVGFGTVFYALTISVFIKVSELLVSFIPIHRFNVIQTIACIIVAQVILTLGMSLVICADIGKNSLDALIFQGMENKKIAYGTVRTIVDIVYTAIGYTLGGVVGVGTIFSVMSTGLLMNYFIDVLKKRFDFLS